MTKNKWIVAVVSTISVLTFVAGFAAFSFISNASAQSNSNPSAGLTTEQRPQPFFDGKQRTPPGADQELLAKALGISLEKLQAAQEAAQKAALVEAVEKGLITQAQADEINQRGLSNRGSHGMWFGQDSDVDMDSMLAEQLGISVEELQSARNQAQEAAWTQAVKDGKLTEEQVELMKIQNALRDYLQDAQQEALNAAVAKAVADGAITQDQADLFLKNGPDGPSPWMIRPLGMPGRHGGSGGPDGMPQYAPPVLETTPDTE